MRRGKFKRTVEYKERMSVIMKNVKRTPKGREDGRQGALKYWKEISLNREEISKKRSEAMFRYLANLKENKKVPYWTGKKMSDATRQKMRESHIGLLHSEEAKKKIKFAKMGDKNPRWRGGRKITDSSYVCILIKNHPFASKKGYVFEHRLVVEKFLGRYLQPGEYVHHCNKNKKDNRPVNLIAFSSHRDHSNFENGHDVPSERIIFDGRNYQSE